MSVLALSMQMLQAGHLLGCQRRALRSGNLIHDVLQATEVHR